jgi:FtsP/CotA-like multicopper oxidase with cupredoxin domain
VLCVIGGESTSPFNEFREYSLDELGATTGSRLLPNVKYNTSYTNSYRSTLTLVNGMHKPAITLSRNSPSILRFVNGGGGAPLRLKLSNNRLCSWAVLAWDGVYIKNRSPQIVLYIVPGGRCEVEVLCTKDGKIIITKRCVTIADLLMNHSKQGRILFTIWAMVS